MIFTSYYDKIKELPDNVIPVSIAGKAPDWYKGIQYKKLAPKLKFFEEWKKNKDNEAYTLNYNRLVLADLDIYDVIREICNRLDDKDTDLLYKTDSYIQDSTQVNIALVCYEKPGKFCHRHLVAEWFRQNGIEVKEWEDSSLKDKTRRI
jgi:hypothetical protein